MRPSIKPPDWLTISHEVPQAEERRNTGQVESKPSPSQAAGGRGRAYVGNAGPSEMPRMARCWLLRACAHRGAGPPRRAGLGSNMPRPVRRFWSGDEAARGSAFSDPAGAGSGNRPGRAGLAAGPRLAAAGDPTGPGMAPGSNLDDAKAKGSKSEPTQQKKGPVAP